MSKKRVYISGAIAHYDLEERKAAFSEAAKNLELEGYEPVNPFDNGLPQPGDWREHMWVDVGMLLKCQYIYMLKGWWASKGAKLELDVASSCGLKPLFEHDEIHNEEQECCICGKKFYGIGNDPYPVKNEGVCCENCQWEVVLPRRFSNKKD
jgi:hypothetical protein